MNENEMEYATTSKQWFDGQDDSPKRNPVPVPPKGYGWRLVNTCAVACQMPPHFSMDHGSRFLFWTWERKIIHRKEVDSGVPK